MYFSERGTKCLNCNTPLDISERYCHYCGQKNSTERANLKAYIEEFFSNFYAYDSKIRSTFRHLFTKPSFVAVQIIKGRRNTFANPFRLFLSVIIIFFLLKSTLEENNSFKINTNYEIKSSNNNIQSNTFKLYNKETINNTNFIDRLIKKIENFYKLIRNNENITAEKAIDTLKYSKDNTNIYLFNKAYLYYDLEKNKWNSILGRSFLEKRPILIFLFLPFIAIGFSIAFKKSNYNYTENLIFTYLLATVLYIKFIIDLITNQVLSFSISGITNFIFFLYFYKSLRKFYGYNRLKTIYKFVILNIVTFIMVIPVIIAMALTLYIIS